MNVRSIEGECSLTRFRGFAPALVNATFENSLINGVSNQSEREGLLMLRAGRLRRGSAG